MKLDVHRDYYADLGLKAGASPSTTRSQHKKLGESLTYQIDAVRSEKRLC